MKLIENYIVTDDGNILSDGKILKGWGLRLFATKITDLNLLKMLSQNEYWLIRCGVAKNHFASHSILSLLSYDSVPNVRYWVATNPTTPQDILAHLTADKDYYVRMIAKENYLKK